MRKAFADVLEYEMQRNEKIVFLTGDLGFQVFDSIAQKFPKRFINVGIAEAQLVNAAAGLALEGFRPVIYSIASFMTARPYEQLKLAIAYHQLPVIVVGAGGGYTYANAGVTHYAPDDLMLMTALPGEIVVTPGGPDEMRILFSALLQKECAAYLRVGKYGESDVGYMENSPVSLGTARCILPAGKITFVTGGEVFSSVAPAILEYKDSVNPPGFFHYHTMEPFDRETALSILKQSEKIAIFEESLKYGGIYGHFCQVLAEYGSRLNRIPEILRFGAPDNEFVYGSPSRGELRSRLGISSEQVHKLMKG